MLASLREFCQEGLGAPSMVFWPRQIQVKGPPLAEVQQTDDIGRHVPYSINTDTHYKEK